MRSSCMVASLSAQKKTMAKQKTKRAFRSEIPDLLYKKVHFVEA